MWVVFVVNLMANNLMNAWLPMIVQIGGHSAAQGRVIRTRQGGCWRDGGRARETWQRGGTVSLDREQKNC